MTPTQINHKSDFPLLIRLTDSGGNPVPFPECDWEAIFWTSSKAITYVAARRDGEFINCRPQSDGAVLFIFNSHRLPPGQLHWAFRPALPDELYPDGTCDINAPDDLNVELITGRSQFSFEQIEATLSAPYVKGDKGDAFTFADFTPEQIAELQRPATEAAESVAATEDDIKAAEALRLTTESARVSAEQARAEAESARAAAEQSRATAEQARAAEESARRTAESGRADAESSRNIAESSRSRAESAREAAEAARAASYAKIEQHIDTRVNEVLLTVNTVAKSVSDETTRAQTAEATKQDKITTSEDLSLSEDNVLSLTDMAKMRLFIDMWNTACGKYGRYNEATGFFERNGLTLTYDEALAVLDAGHVSLDYANARFSGYKGRTVLPLTRGINPASKYLFQNAVNLEVVDVDLMPVDDGTFKGCASLVRIEGTMQWNKLTKQSFARCAALETIADLRINTATADLSESPALTLQTLTSMVQKCTAKSCTITVHANVYAKLTDTANTQWHQVMLDAAEKNIQFVTL